MEANSGNMPSNAKLHGKTWRRGFWMGTAVGSAVLGLAAAVLGLSIASQLQQENTIVCDAEEQLIAPETAWEWTFDAWETQLLVVTVTELFGRSIEFRVLQDGREVYRSGVQPGQAQGRTIVLAGVVTLEVMNENILKTKRVRVDARLRDVDENAPALTFQ